MERVRSRIFEEFRPRIEPGITEYIEAYLESEESVERYDVGMDPDGQILVHAVLVKFSFVAAKSVFLELSELIRRSCFNIYTNEESEEQVRYLFVTGVSGRDGIKMEMVID